jgi:hypothetical protein
VDFSRDTFEISREIEAAILRTMKRSAQLSESDFRGSVKYISQDQKLIQKKLSRMHRRVLGRIPTLAGRNRLQDNTS